MFDNILLSNDHFEVILEKTQVYIKVQQKGYEMSQFNALLESIPRVKVTEFVSLKMALDDARDSVVKIGQVKPLVEVTISKDQLRAEAIILMPPDNFQEADKDKLVEQILKASSEQSILFGIDVGNIVSEMKAIEPFVIAKGKEPIPGDDAIITVYELKGQEPELYQDGKVNHYEMNLINTVVVGDWLGERIEPTAGKDGVSVLGKPLIAPHGRQEALKYDTRTVQSFYDEEKQMTILRAKTAGAVIFLKDKVSVCSFLDIDGDVSFYTGNIDFDGFVQISNTVEDNFSVEADNDIQIMGVMGIGGVDKIESREGNIYIRGGVAGKNKAVIRCHGDFYTKFAADCEIICSGKVSIGYYAMNCNIKAQEVILEADNSQIIGGSVEATARVVVSDLGSRAGVPTHVNVTGFDREQIQKDYKLIDTVIEGARKKMNRHKEELSQYSINLDERTRVEMQAVEAEYEKYKSQVDDLLKRKETYVSFLRAKGSGEIVINKCLYQKVSVKIEDGQFNSTEAEKLPVKFYYDQGELHKE